MKKQTRRTVLERKRKEKIERLNKQKKEQV